MVYPAACDWFILQSVTVVITVVYPAYYHYGLSCRLLLWFIIAVCMYLTVSCSPGREDQNGTCRECHVGFYKNRTGAVECHACPQGFRTPTNGSTDPADCSVGELVLAVLSMHHCYHILSAFLFIETRSEVAFCELVHDQIFFGMASM